MKRHTYQVQVNWTGNIGQGTRAYNAYSRDHTIAAKGKPEIPGSSDPSFRGDPTRYNPEELLVASLSTCHMLWYLHLCSDNGITVVDYQDQANGLMEEHQDGSGEFVRVTLKPTVTISPADDYKKAFDLHSVIHNLCFIARSVKFPVDVEPVIEKAAPRAVISAGHLRIAAFCAYLAAWLVFAVAALVSAIPPLSKQAIEIKLTAPLIAGTFLQAVGAFALTRSMRDGPLQPSPFELSGAFLLAPLAAVLFVWATQSVPTDAPRNSLVTAGAYSWLRHPIYLAFLAMLVATGLILSSGLKMLVPVILYLAGSELRIASEEMELTEQFPEAYPAYRRRTRWRYLPGLR